MLSEKSFKPMIWAMQLGYLLKVVSAFWDKSKDLFEVEYGKKYFIPLLSKKCYFNSKRVIPITFLVLQCANILYLIIFLIFTEHSIADIYLSLMVLVIMYLGFSAQLNIVFCIDDFCYTLNTLFALHQRYRK